MHVACQSHIGLDRIQFLVEKDIFTLLEKTENGATPFQLFCETALNENEDMVTVAYLFLQQANAVSAIRLAVEAVVTDQLGLPDLVRDLIWEFAQPDLW